MEKLFDITLQNRKILYKVLKNTPKEKLLRIPDGYRNNIWWNIAHVVVTQQLLIYEMSGLPIHVPNEFVDKFKKGTVPDGLASDEEIGTIKGLLFLTVERSKEDYQNGLFKNYEEYTTSANVTLRNADDALAFNVFHEGLHLGTILSLQKML